MQIGTYNFHGFHEILLVHYPKNIMPDKNYIE